MLTDTVSDAKKQMRAAPQISVTKQENGEMLCLSGRWTTHCVNQIDMQMRKLERSHRSGFIQIDMSDVQGLDTAGAWLIERLRQSFEGTDVQVEIIGLKASWQPLMQEVGKAVEPVTQRKKDKKDFFLTTFFAAIGEGVFSMYKDFKMSMYILGSTIRGSQMKQGRGTGISMPAIVHQMHRMGVGAIPIVMLMSMIVGAIIAQQGAFQLRYFGAEIFVVDLVGILVLRELGVLLTAIMIAGRSGSAITAEIGSMKMREETDALKVMGLNPVGVLVFPRLVALVIVLPLLTILADVAALLGAGGVAWFYSNISPEAFIARLHDAVALNTYFAGLIKAPFMAMIIGIMASVEGLKVGGSAESLGRRVTASVVKSIFVVIVIDGLFAMFYAAIDF
ncbi:ABC transporter permease [Paenochrobactrum pullorum]|uniref:ABC transporter permease n=1 Tax=Paenochrobactrum pullorum TaxID=1324351 RepID=UPI0035BC04D8